MCTKHASLIWSDQLVQIRYVYFTHLLFNSPTHCNQMYSNLANLEATVNKVG